MRVARWGSEREFCCFLVSIRPTVGRCAQVEGHEQDALQMEYCVSQLLLPEQNTDTPKSKREIPPTPPPNHSSIG